MTDSCITRECELFSCSYGRTKKTFIDKKPFINPDDYIKEINTCSKCSNKFKFYDPEYSPCVSKIWKKYHIFCTYECYLLWLKDFNKTT